MVRHLLKAIGIEETYSITACGLRSPAVFTVNIERVTCLSCQRSAYMVDAKFRKQQEEVREEQPDDRC